MDINTEIAERIMGWAVVDREKRLYRNPRQQEGSFIKSPDFLLADHNLLRETMKSGGYELTITETPPDFEKDIGRISTASYARQGATFESIQPEEVLAVCCAALKAYGVTHLG